MIVSNATGIRCQGFKSRLGGASIHRYAAERFKKTGIMKEGEGEASEEIRGWLDRSWTRVLSTIAWDF